MTPNEIGVNLEKYTYEYFMNEALGYVPQDIDIREGSIMFDALAPACYQLADLAMELKNVMLETFVTTATGGYLDLRAEEAGVRRILATQAVAKVKVVDANGEPYVLDLGTRFSSIGDDPVYYKITAFTDIAGTYLMTADVAGSTGNEYVGTILPIDNLNNFGQAEITEISIPARDDETDESLRSRVIAEKGIGAFGGNVEDYIRMANEVDGVGAVQVYPTWQGGGTVLLSILNNEFKKPAQTLVDLVQNTIDPDKTGAGLGLAPIGHKVTVKAPEEKLLSISFYLTTDPGIDSESVMSAITTAVEKYFDTTRRRWAERREGGYTTWIYRSQITSAILSVSGVANVNNVKIGNQDEDVQMTLDNTKQEIPILKEVRAL